MAGKQSVEDRIAHGRDKRREVPHASHAEWKPTPDRRVPVEWLEVQAQTRIPELIPIRHGRMLVSPFTYYRGAALAMAADLATTPSSGLTVQVCGDAHLSNFGIFGSPERHLVFDVNDFDETAPGPWEWDVKRLAASLEIAGRDNEFLKKDRSRIVRQMARSYRETMREFARQPTLDVWYARLDIEALMPQFQSLLDAKRTPSVWRAISTARAHDSLQAFEKLCDTSSGSPRILSDPPLILPVEELLSDLEPTVVMTALEKVIHTYGQSLDTHRRCLLDQYRLVHVARKVVGVGSVGTDSWIALLLDRDVESPLMLQIKQAEPSVLEQFTKSSVFSNHGHRVVAGQRLMQAESDIFLGWERAGWGDFERDYYIRQLRDWKGSADIRGMTVAGMELWGQMCGWTLARAHARSGDRIAIAAYLGKSDQFDRSIAEFARAYANQNELDYAVLKDAVESGRLDAAIGF